MLNPRLDLLPGYPFPRMRALLADLKPPSHRKVISMSVGEPRNGPPAFVADIMAANAEGLGKYPPIAGTPECREAIARWLTRRYGLPDGLIDPERHLAPVGGTREALFSLAQIILDPAGDMTTEAGGHTRPAVLMPNPFYQIYVGAAVMAGAEPIYVNATADSNHLPDFSTVDDATWQRTQLVYMCSPANPQGAMADGDMLADLVERVRAVGAVLISDECYSEIYDRQPPPGIIEVCHQRGLGLDNVLAVNSLSKRSSAPGLRAGFVAGDPRLIAAYARWRVFATGHTPYPVYAAAAALWNDEAHVEANRAYYRKRLDIAERVLAGRFGFARRQEAFSCGLTSATARKPPAGCGARPEFRCCPAAIWPRITRATIRADAIFASPWSTTKPPWRKP